jgi:acetyl-CoA C-acetyltransferase
MTQFGELWSSSLRDLFTEAALGAMRSAGVDTLDAVYVGNMSGGQFVGQEHVGPLMVDALGVAGVPSTRVESACASGGAALRMGFLDVASGQSDVVLVAGVEKMSDGADVTTVLATASDQETEVYHGITFPGLYAMIARAHMASRGSTEEDLHWVSVKNHRHGAMNPRAQFPKAVTLDEVANSSPVADPLRLLHCSPVSDGGAAVILMPLEQARRITDRPVQILGTGMATASLALADRRDPAVLDAVGQSARKAFTMAGIEPADVDLAEVHDCFAIAEICCLEAMCLTDGCSAADAARSGFSALGGRRPINTSGGLKSKGHPVGATGVAQVIEIFEQLRGEAGDRQVRDAHIGVTQNMGGTGASSVVHVFRRV